MFKLLIGIGIGLWIGLEFAQEVRGIMEILNEYTN
tara:strand:- start:37 stop:141 length:105 start_codon:yes stop_codon:yes gene_type:complete